MRELFARWQSHRCVCICKIMKMCYDAALMTLFIVALFSDTVLPDSILLPFKTEDGNEAILFEPDLDERIIRQKRHQLAATSNTAWFGPRLGRKKRSASFNDEALETPNEVNSGYYVQLLKNYPRATVFLVNENGKDHLRMVRYNRGNMWLDDDDNDNNNNNIARMIPKAPPFSPRLGRRSLIPLKPRLGRGGNSAEALALFKPRLGRDPGFNEIPGEYSETSRNNLDDKDH